jgi:hypothetical protein
MSALNNIATTDAYSDASTLVAPLSTRLRCFVRNAAIYRQLASRGSVGGPSWENDELFTPPGNYSFDEGPDVFYAARVRSAVAGRPAQVTLEATQ